MYLEDGFHYDSLRSRGDLFFVGQMMSFYKKRRKEREKKILRYNSIDQERTPAKKLYCKCYWVDWLPQKANVGGQIINF